MRRSTQRAHTRRRILREARHLFGRKGVSATRTADVAKRAGLSHGAVFVHFPTREGLVSEVVSELAREITDSLHASIAEGASLKDVLRTHLECLSKHERTYAAFLRESTLLPRDVLRSWVGTQSAISTYLSRAATRDAESGHVRAIPQHLLFNTWVGLVHHYLMNRELFAPRTSVLAKHGEELVQHFHDLLAGPDAPTGELR